MEVVVISDATVKLPKSVTDRMNLTSMKLLGPEWIIQCLIQGRKVEQEPFVLGTD